MCEFVYPGKYTNGPGLSEERRKSIVEAAEEEGRWYLNLRSLNMKDEDAKWLAEVIIEKNYPLLTYIDIQRTTYRRCGQDMLNNITDEGAKHIVKALKRNYIIRNMDLGVNPIGDYHKQEIERLLNENKEFFNKKERGVEILHENLKLHFCKDSKVFSDVELICFQY